MKRTIYYWIDHTAKCPTNTGMQRVTRYLGRSLLKNYQMVVFVRWDHERKCLVLANQDELRHLAQFNGPQLDRTSLENYPAGDTVRVLHEMTDFTPKDGWLVVPEVTHITLHPTVPTLDAIAYARHYGLKSAFIFYDAIPLKLPEYAAGAEAHATYMQHLAMADVVIPISNYAGDDYVSYLKSFVYFDDLTLPVVRPVSLPGEDPACARAERFDITSEEIMILSVGTVEPRKNQIRLIDAFNQVCGKYQNLALRLVLVGNLHPAVAEQVQEGVQKNRRIDYLSYVEDSKLKVLYHRCAFTVYPSLEEGFGLPILESLWHGKPCVCANFGAMQEAACGGGCLQVDVRSANEIAAAMERLILDENQRRTLVQEALTKRIKTWDEYSSEISGVVGENSNLMSKVGRILYWVDHTSTHMSNSVIQRIVRQLAKSLLAMGVELVPVKWDTQNEVFIAPTHEELEHLARWAGPDLDSWMLSDDLGPHRNAWLLVPEWTAYPDGPNLSHVIGYAASIGLRSAVFYDASQSKMQHPYPAVATADRADRMIALNGSDLVLATSEQGRTDLREFLLHKQNRLIGIDDRILAVSLPDECISTSEENWHESSNGKLINEDFEQEQPNGEAISRPVKTWQSFAKEVLAALAERSAVHGAVPAIPIVEQLYPPLLSICITTYNRAPWLNVSLKQLIRLISQYSDVVELVVCDNASSDDTPSVAARYDGFPGFRYFRNKVNVGMLGNLRETVHHARGRFVWLLGDDDIVKPGSLEKVLSVILDYPGISLIYLNYAYTNHNAPRAIEDIDEFIASAIPISPLCEDRCVPISELATLSENFFTAIYCLIFRRDHAIKAYSQDTIGRQFSSLLTCIPTAHYVCNSMFEEMGYWVGRPSVVVNMNVSWMKYAALWRLERLPELHELAEMRGAVPTEVDRWRVHNLHGASQYLKDIYLNDPEGNRTFFFFREIRQTAQTLTGIQSGIARVHEHIQRGLRSRRWRNILDRASCAFQSVGE